LTSRAAEKGDVMHIHIERTTHPSTAVPDQALGFGQVFTDHMYRAMFSEGRGWEGATIVERAPLALDPAATSLQYGQSIFEGLKAFRVKGGAVRLFRPAFHAARFAASARRLCLPEVPEQDFLQAVSTLVAIDRRFVPSAADSSLYLRPTLIGTEAFLGVRPSATAEMFVLGCPVGAYWKGGRRPLSIWVETELSRASKGGTGAAKCGGNYAVAMLASQRAKVLGFDQVLFLDASTHTRLEEIGTMNVFLKVGEKVITPPLDGTILAGATRDCVITLLQDWGMAVEERVVTLEEIEHAHRAGQLHEMFGTGTASVVAPIGRIGHGAREMHIGDGKEGQLTRALYQALVDIQSGQAEDRHGWLVDVPEL
jgi:branched-chain amino acid aminotransferase